MKIGVLGSGMIANEVVPHLRGYGAEPVAVCGTPRSMDKTKALCEENGIPNAFSDFGEMLEKADMDTVYVAVPNFLHFSMVKQALLAGKHVIVEKPMTSNYKEAEELARLAGENDRFLFEAITTLHLKNYKKIREWLPRIGEIKIVWANFSQYSSRYDAFKRGEVLPVFDPSKSGGALMDLNLYNLHYILGLFGRPKEVHYSANIERGIDTSGIVSMDFGSFKSMAIAAKDCAAPIGCVIQGTKGYISQDTAASICGEICIHLNDGTEEFFNSEPESRFEEEFKDFVRAITENDREYCEKMLEKSLLVSEIQTAARNDAGIVFAADRDF